MSITIIIFIIIIGLLLLLIDVFFLPGTFVVGIIGGGLMVYGIYKMFQYHGNLAGGLTLVLTGVTAVGVTVWGFKTASKNKDIVIQSSIDSKVNTVNRDNIAVGDKGKTISVLRPNGKALFGKHKFEVYSQGDYIEIDTEVEVIKIAEGKVYIKQINITT